LVTKSGERALGRVVVAPLDDDSLGSSPESLGGGDDVQRLAARQKTLLKAVAPQSLEAQQVARHYYNTVQIEGNAGWHVKHVYRVQNERLLARYTACRDHRRSSCVPGGVAGVAGAAAKKAAKKAASTDNALVSLGSDEARLFHGTSPEVAAAICQQGFDFRLAGANGTAHGAGVNFAKRASYSLSYATRN
jgi:hypothetical protein